MKLASTSEINKAKLYLENDEVDLAIKELEKLIARYPSDGRIYYELGTLLLRQGKDVSRGFYYLSLATNERTKNAINFDIGIYYLYKGEFDKAKEKFESLLDQDDTYKCYGYYGLIRVYIHTEEFDKALDCFKKIDKLHVLANFEISHYHNLKFYLLFKNNLEIDDSRADNYFRKQVINYSKESAIEHVKDHLKDSNSEELKPKRVHSVFEKGTDIEAIYDYCDLAIKDKKPSSYGIVDYYMINLDDKIGVTYSKKETKYVEVMTIPNTKQILSIYPVYEKHVNKIACQKEETKPKGKKKKYKKNRY